MLEFMELDEFLIENDIPIESVLHDGPPQINNDPKQNSKLIGLSLF